MTEAIYGINPWYPALCENADFAPLLTRGSGLIVYSARDDVE